MNATDCAVSAAAFSADFASVLQISPGVTDNTLNFEVGALHEMAALARAIGAKESGKDKLLNVGQVCLEPLFHNLSTYRSV